MKKTLSLLVLVPTFFCGINNPATKAQIPQASFQEIYIEGYSNQVIQELNQNLNLNFISIPEIEGELIPNFNIQGTFLDNPNNEVNQEINQNVFNLSLIPLSLTSFGVNDFLGDDNVLNGVQFNEQQAFVQGDNNLTNQLSSQTLTEFFLLEQSDEITEPKYFHQLLTELLDSQLLDSFQFGSQDTLLFGHNNVVNQSLTQTFDIFIFLTSDSNPLLSTDAWTEANLLKPIQLTIQETFIDVSENNFISQTINQSLNKISLIESSIFSPKNHLLPGFKTTNIGSDNLVELDIDVFINEILNNTIIEGKQINRQLVEVIGNSNESLQENEQELIVSIPEPSNLRMMVVLSVIICIRCCQILLRQEVR